MADGGEEAAAAACLAEACSVEPAVAYAALARHGGDADAAATDLLLGGGPPAADARSGAPPSSSCDFRQLLEMGYSQADTQRALSTAGSLEGALELLLAGGDEQQAASGTAGQQQEQPAAPVDDCVICQEPLRLSDAAMRCEGRGGVHHYCHAACLAEWIGRCQREERQPECPTCRGPLQLNRRRLRHFLNGSGADDSADCQGPRRRRGHRISQEDEEVLRRLMQQADSNSGAADDDDGWHSIKFEEVAGLFLMGAAVVAGGFLLKAAIDGLSKPRGRDRDRQ